MIFKKNYCPALVLVQCGTKNFLKINIDNEDYKQLSELLGVKIETANTVKGIEAEQLYQQDMDEKFYALNKFEVTLLLSDNSIIQDVHISSPYH